MTPAAFTGYFSASYANAVSIHLNTAQFFQLWLPLSGAQESSRNVAHRKTTFFTGAEKIAKNIQGLFYCVDQRFLRQRKRHRGGQRERERERERERKVGKSQSSLC